MMKSILFLFIFVPLFLSGSSIRIMPLGDSITYDDAYNDVPRHGGTPRPEGERYAYRSFLWYQLKDAGHEIDFVGSQHAGYSITPPFDPDNEGYPGETSQFIANHIYAFLENNPADIILLHIGSNDWSRNVSYIKDILDEIDRYETNYHHTIHVLVAKIIQKREFSALIHDFNINLENLIESRQQSGDILTVVDMENQANLEYGDYQDPIHPNDNGYQKMALLWYTTLDKILKKDFSWLPAIYHSILY